MARVILVVLFERVGDLGDGRERPAVRVAEDDRDADRRLVHEGDQVLGDRVVAVGLERRNALFFFFLVFFFVVDFFLNSKGLVVLSFFFLFFPQNPSSLTRKQL